VIVLDTNVVSEPLRPRPDPLVIQWLDDADPETLYLTATVLSEVLTGIALLPAGKRKRGMLTGTEALHARLFADRFLPFDREAAVASALLSSRAAARGYIISAGDCQIAAIASVYNCAVATRDTAPFRAADVPIINPWES
jgi:hypothetical protein